MLFLFLRSLRYRWFEYVLAAVVIAVPIATLTVQRSLSSLTEDQIHAQAHKLGSNILVLPSETELVDFYGFRYGTPVMPDSYSQQLGSSNLRQQIGFIQSRLYANIDLRQVPLIVVGQESTARGRTYPPPPFGAAFLGETALSRLGLQENDKLEINDQELTVAGLIRRPPDGLDVAIFASLETVQETLSRPEQINAMQLSGCWCRTDIPALASQVEKVLPDTKALTMAGTMKAQKGTVAQAKRYSTVTLVVAVLMIGAIVMMLIASQVKRQIREIGFLLATGASPQFIILLFVAKAGIVGALGGLAGYFLGFPLTERIASNLVGLPLSVPESMLGMTLTFAIVVSTLSALLPAARAATLDPTVVLREI